MCKRPNDFRVLPAVIATITALAALSCSESGPRVTSGHFAVVPVFTSEAAGIVPVAAGRFVLRRAGTAQIVKDTVIQIPAGADSVDLTFSVPLTGSGETFDLTLALVNAAGDTVFRAGPIVVTPTTGGQPPPAVILPLAYTGTGADAASLVILSPDTSLKFGEGATFVAEARDSAGQPIPGTPIEWRALDSARVSVLKPDSGGVMTGGQRGLARVVARLLTGPADTLRVTAVATPNSIAVDGGNDQTGPSGTPLPLPLVARVLAVDALGVEGVWVRFTVVTGAGSLTADSVLTDADGRAAVIYTPGPAGPQVVVASTAGVSAPATFAATAVSAGPGTIFWIDPAGGDWSDGTNWSGGLPPGPQDTAVIALDGDYTVSVDADVTVARLIVGGASGTQTLLQTANNLVTNDGSFGSNAIYVLSGNAGFAGTGQGTGTVSVSGAVDWSGGAIAHDGTVAVAPTGILNVTGGTATLRNGTLSNQGTITWLGGNVTLADGATLTNSGNLVASGDGQLAFGGGGGGTFVNAAGGTFAKVTATGSTSFLVPTTNDGGFSVLSGQVAFGNNLSFTHAGTFVGGPGTVLSFGGTGTHVLDSTITGFARVETSNAPLTLNGSVTTGHLSVGTFADITVNAPLAVDSVTASRALVLMGGGPFTIPYLRLAAGGAVSGTADLDITDSLIWAGGSLLGSGTVTLGVSAIARLSGTSAKVIDGQALDVAGSAFWTGGTLTLDDEAALGVLAGGVFDMQADLAMEDGPAGGTLDVQGTFRKSGGTGTGTIAPPVVVGGTLEVVAGTLGVTGPFALASGGRVQGTGTLDLTAASVSAFDGMVNPGTSPGMLTLVPAFAPGTAAALNIELGGITVGTQYDRLVVSGPAALGGTLNVTLIPGFTPTLGQQFTVLSYTAVTGDFAQVNLPALPIGVTWQRITGATDMTLTVVVVGPPPQIVFAGDSANLVATAAIIRVDGDGQKLTAMRPLANGLQTNNRFHPRWAPDRSRVAFGVEATFNELRVASADGVTEVTVVGDTTTLYPRWSGDGNHLAFECGTLFGPLTNQDVCVIGDATGTVIDLSRRGDGAGKLFITDFDTRNWLSGSGAFAWDPNDPAIIAFVRDSLDQQGLPASMIFTGRFDGAGIQPLATGGHLLDPGGAPMRVVTTMDWSEDGAFLVFAGLGRSGEQGLYVINRDGSGLRQLTSGFVDERPVISPDGKQVFFLRLDGQGIGNFFHVDVATSAVEQVGTDNFVDFSPSDLSYDYSPNGAEIVISAWETAFGNVRIYRIFPTTVAATYLTDRLPIGRSPPVLEYQPTWRP